MSAKGDKHKKSQSNRPKGVKGNNNIINKNKSAKRENSTSTDKIVKSRISINNSSSVRNNVTTKTVVKNSKTIADRSTGTLNCLYLNARSIVNKHSELEIYVNDENIDIIGITETWMTSSISDNEMNIDGYTLLRQDRNDEIKQRGGGVALYIRNNLNFVRRDELYATNFPESIWCSIQCAGENTLIGVCYRAPDCCSVNDEALYSLIDMVSKEDVIIMGDFNFPQFNWNRIETLDVEHPFIECINDNFLSQLVEEPTRGSNYLDLLFCSECSLIENVIVGEPFETSDHQVIRFNLVGKRVLSVQVKKYFNYFKADYDAIRFYARSRNWESTLGNSNVDEIWQALKMDLVDIRNKLVPLSKPRRSKCKWVTKTVTKLRKAKKNAWIKYVNGGRNCKLYDAYKTKLRKSVRENKNAQCNFKENLAKNVNNDSKSFYSYVRSKQRSKVRVGPLKDNTGNVISDNKTTADVFNKYFSSVFTIENLSSIPNPVNIFNHPMSESLTDLVISEEIVGNKLYNLDS
ncbi:MAG: endonuclease/exonuclease/phosphatase family protein [Chitinophagaceae bacterium]